MSCCYSGLNVIIKKKNTCYLQTLPIYIFFFPGILQHLENLVIKGYIKLGLYVDDITTAFPKMQKMWLLLNCCHIF